MEPTQQPRTVDVALGIIRCNGNILLLQRRSKHVEWDKKWEFPGGKVEEQETSEQALVRELHEETGLRVSSYAFIGTHTHVWNLSETSVHVRLHCFFVEQTEEVGKGVPVTIEDTSCYAYAWVPQDELLHYDLLGPNRTIFEMMIAGKTCA